MTGCTHLAAGATVGLCVGAITPGLDPITAMAAAGFSALLPDIDTPTSKLGRRTGPVSGLIGFLFGHRGLFHAPALYLTIYCILFFAFPPHRLIFLCALTGVMSHLLLDALNPMGIPLIWPVSSRRFHFAKLQTGGLTDRLLCLLLTIGVIAQLFKLFS